MTRKTRRVQSSMRIFVVHSTTIGGDVCVGEINTYRITHVPTTLNHGIGHTRNHTQVRDGLTPKRTCF